MTFSISGYAYVAMAALLWAVSGTASKFLFISGISPFQLVQLRATIASVSLLLCLLIFQPSFLRVQKKEMGHLFILGILFAITQFTYLYAISRINVAAAILLQYLAPVFIVVYSAAFERERLQSNALISVLGTVLGCYLMVGAYSMDILNMNMAGIISGLSSAVGFALYTVRSGKRMADHNAWTVLFYALIFAALFWNIVYPPTKAFQFHYEGSLWLVIVFIAVFGTILPFGFYNKGIKLIRPAKAGITATLEPVAAGIISYIFLGEKMQALQVIGALTVISSIIFLRQKT